MNEYTEKSGNLLERAADLLADLMQTIFLTVLKPFVGLAQRMSDRLKNFLIGASFFGIMVIIYLEHTNITSLILQHLPLPSVVKYVFFDLLGCVLMAVVAVCSIKGPLQRRSCNAMMTLLWAGMCIFFIVSAIYTSLDWAAISIIFTLVFPCVYFIWNNRRDYGTLFRLVTKGLVSFNLVFFVLSVLFSPITGGQYRALFTNANSLGQYLTCTIPLFMMNYTLAWRKIGQKPRVAAPVRFDAHHPGTWFRYLAFVCRMHKELIPSLLGLGTSVALIVFSRSRTALLAAAVTLVLWFVLNYIVAHWGEGFKAIALRAVQHIVPMVLAVVICVPGTFWLIKGGTYVVYYYAAVNDLLPEGYEYLDPRLQGTRLDDAINAAMDRLDTEGKTADQVTTHRTLIWKAFAQRIEPFGHERGQIYVHDYGVAATAHNCIIQILYDSGIFTALFYFAINVASGFRALLYYFRRRKGDAYAIFPVLLMPGYLVTSLLASSYPPFAYSIALVYWLIQAPLFEKKIHKLDSLPESV